MRIKMVFQHIDRSNALESYIHDLSMRLERFHGRVAGCDWTIEGAPGASGTALHYAVKIHLDVPGAQIHAQNPAGGGPGQADLDHALHQAFDDAKRQLRDLKCDRVSERNG